MVNAVKDKLRENSFTGPAYHKLASYRYSRKREKRQSDLQKYGEDAFRLVVNTLKDADIRFFPTFGTLLGLIRDGRIISHDLDIDFGVISEKSEYDWNRLKSALEAAGFNILRWFEHDDVVHEMAFVSPMSKLFNIDFFVFYRTEEESFNFEYARKRKLEYRDKNDFIVYKDTFPKISAFEQKEYMGVSVPIPVNAETLLEASYTSSWRIPDPDWKFFDKPNCKEVEGVVGTVYFNQ